MGLFILCLKIFFNMPAAGIHTTQDMNLRKTSASHVLEHGQTNLFVSANRSLERYSSSRERSHYIFLFQRNKTLFAVRTILESNLNRNFIINYNLILLFCKGEGDESGHRTPLDFVMSLYSAEVHWTNFYYLFNLA